MKSLSSVGLGLSLVFGCLFLALVAEVYYLLWWKKKIINRDLEDGYSSTGTAKEFLYMFCWKKPPTLRLNSHEVLVHEPQAPAQGNSSKDSWAHMPYGEDSVEADLMRLQNFSGPPRFLFTIKEETKEDLESEDGKSRGDRSRKGSRGRSLSDLFHVLETPYLTPIASPPYYTPPLTPVKAFHNNQQGFNSFFGSASEAEFNWLLSSPPRMFKFLRDADDKQIERKFREQIDEECAHKFDAPSTSTFLKDEENDEKGSFITLIVNKKIQEELNDDHLENVFQFPSNTSQVLPVASSPPPLKLNSTMN